MAAGFGFSATVEDGPQSGLTLGVGYCGCPRGRYSPGCGASRRAGMEPWPRDSSRIGREWMVVRGWMEAEDQ